MAEIPGPCSIYAVIDQFLHRRLKLMKFGGELHRQDVRNAAYGK